MSVTQLHTHVNMALARRLEMLERNAKRPQVSPVEALEKLAEELEKEADYLDRYDQALSASAENIRYAAEFIRRQFCVSTGPAGRPDAAFAALMGR